MLETFSTPSPLTVSHTILLTVHGATAASASGAVVLARTAVGGEALRRTDQLLLVARTLLFTNHGGTYNPTFGVPSGRTAVSGAVSPAVSTADSVAPPVSKSRYVEPPAAGTEVPSHPCTVAISTVGTTAATPFLVLVLAVGFGGGGVGVGLG
ncbi:hypothetical protein U1Q18_009121 [Sarracenia purpurea var. burkii]